MCIYIYKCIYYMYYYLNILKMRKKREKNAHIRALIVKHQTLNNECNR